MSELATLARPYAIAAYMRAKETNSMAKWSEGLAFLAAVVQDPHIARAEANPKSGKERFVASLLELCQGRLDSEEENFVRLLAANRRLSLTPLISEQFEQFRADDEGYAEVEVRTAYPLDGAESGQLEAVLRQTLGKEPRLKIQVDEALIGGVLIRAGDRVIDASVRGQIQRLAKQLGN